MDFRSHVASLHFIVTAYALFLFFLYLFSFFLSFSSKFALASPLWKQARLTQNFNTMCTRSQFAVDYEIMALQNYAKILPRTRPAGPGPANTWERSRCLQRTQSSLL